MMMMMMTKKNNEYPKRAIAGSNYWFPHNPIKNETHSLLFFGGGAIILRFMVIVMLQNEAKIVPLHVSLNNFVASRSEEQHFDQMAKDVKSMFTFEK